MRSIGMLATSSRGLRAAGRSRADEVHGPRGSRRPLRRRRLVAATLTAANKVENEYIMWRKDVLAEAPTDSGCADNINQRRTRASPTRNGPYYGGYKEYADVTTRGER